MSESVSSAASSSVEAPATENLESFADEQDVENALQQVLQWKNSSEDENCTRSAEDWAQDHYTTICIRRLCRYQPEKLHNHLDEAFQIPLSMVSNLRSAVSRNALFCIKELIEASKEFLKTNPQCQNRIVDGLIPRMSSEKKFITTATIESLISLGKETGSVDLLDKFMSYSNHKHPQIVSASAKGVNATLSALSASAIEEPILQELIKKAGSYFEGRLPETRDSAKFMVKRIVKKMGKDKVKSLVSRVFAKDQPIKRMSLLRFIDADKGNSTQTSTSGKSSQVNRPVTSSNPRPHTAGVAPSQPTSLRNQIKADKDRVKKQQCDESVKSANKRPTSSSSSSLSARRGNSMSKTASEAPKVGRKTTNSGSREQHSETDTKMNDLIPEKSNTVEPSHHSDEEFSGCNKQDETTDAALANRSSENSDAVPADTHNDNSSDQKPIEMVDSEDNVKVADTEHTSKVEENQVEDKQQEEDVQMTNTTGKDEEAEPSAKKSQQKKQSKNKKQTSNERKSRKHLRELNCLDTENILSTPTGVKRRPRTRATARNDDNTLMSL